MKHRSATNVYYDLVRGGDQEAIEQGKKNPVRSLKSVQRIKEKVHPLKYAV